MWNIIGFGRIETARRCILAIEHKDIVSLKFYILVGLLVSAAGTIRQFTLKQYWRYSVFVMLKSLYSYVYTKITRVDPQIYEEKWSGKVSSILQEGTFARSSTIDKLVDEWIMFIISFLVALWYVYILLWVSYVAVAVLVIILFVIYARSFEKKVKSQRKIRNEILQEWSRHKQKVIMHKHEILTNNWEAKEAEIQSWYYDKAIVFTKKILFYTILQNIWIDLKNIFAYSLYFYLGIQIIEWNSSLSTLTTMLLIVNNVFSQIATLVTIWQEISDNQFKIQVMNDFLDWPKILWYDWWEELIEPFGNIQCENICFQYSKWSQIFHNFSLNIEWKHKTALVGSSGAWKSTLIKLIAWYLHPEDWVVCIGKQELPNIHNIDTNSYASLQSYYRHIGYLTQEPSVFDGTIKDNLMYAVLEQDITEDKLKEIITSAQCSRIYDLKDWLDTEIGEKWIRLSWGQRQRLAIAKIMLKNPSIVLLDEPTSALDSFAEEEVTKAMNNLFQWRTVIIIAHRLQTVKHADEIIVLWNEEWKIGTQILERWNHEELVSTWWFYAKMLELQSGF